MRILHIITGLKDGGAENILYKICKYDSKNKHIIISIISLKNSKKIYSLINQLGVKIYSFDLKFYSIFKFFSLVYLIRSLKPDVVQTWLAHGDFIGGIASRFAGINRVVWNVRYSKLERGVVKLRTLFLIKILSILSYLIPKIIIVVSKSTFKNCKRLGYCSHKLRLIHNGYEILKYNFNKNRNYYRKKFKIKKKIPIVGSVARYDPTKDHKNLLTALSILKKNIDFICILIGSNINKNTELLNLIKKLNLIDEVKLLGTSRNILQSMKGLDIHILSSVTEGFPNVVAEAMLSGTPCVVTDVGDSALIVGNTGWKVEPGNSIKLAKVIEKGFLEIGTKKWKKRSYKASLRIKKNFKIDKMIKRYNLIWSKI